MKICECLCRETLTLLMDTYSTFLEDETLAASQYCVEKEEETSKVMGRFGLLCLEYAKWISANSSSASDCAVAVDRQEHAVHSAVRAASAAFRHQSVAAGWFAAQDNWPAAVSACLCVHSLFRGVLGVPSSRCKNLAKYLYLLSKTFGLKS